MVESARLVACGAVDVFLAVGSAAQIRSTQLTGRVGMEESNAEVRDQTSVA